MLIIVNPQSGLTFISSQIPSSPADQRRSVNRDISLAHLLEGHFHKNSRWSDSEKALSPQIITPAVYLFWEEIFLVRASVGAIDRVKPESSNSYLLSRIY